MKIKSLFLFCCFSLLMEFWLAPEAFSAPAVTIAPTSDSVYILQGNDFSGIGGVDITVRYDAAALSGPRVVQGGLVAGGLMAVNSSTPGKIRLAVVRPTTINGSGTIATVTFDRLKSTGTDILSLASSAITSSGSSISMMSQIVNSVKTADTGAPPSENGSTLNTASAPAANVPSASATAPMGAIGLVVPLRGDTLSDGTTTTPPTDQAAADALNPTDHASAPLETAKATPLEKPVPPAPEQKKKKTLLYKSVLERFKEFSGVKTPKALMALFDRQDKEEKQDPPIVLSNGKATVKIVLELDSKGESNNFLLDGVNLVSLKNKEKNFWIVELLPDPRAYEATISVPWKKEWRVIPLTIAPPMDVKIDRSATRLTEADFKVYLKTKGTIKAPRFDLNGDGVRNYIDDYIFTANYLSQRSEVTAKPSLR